MSFDIQSDSRSLEHIRRLHRSFGLAKKPARPFGFRAFLARVLAFRDWLLR